MFWWQKKQAAKPPADATPAAELGALGPVHRSNHIAYVPAKEFSGVPGVGTGNLAYVPDFLLSAPAFFTGNTSYRAPNSITIANRPAVITHPKTVLEGVGGVIAGQIVHQPLVAIEIQTDTGVGE